MNSDHQIWSDKRTKEEKRARQRRVIGASKDKNKWVRINDHEEMAKNSGPSVTPASKQAYDSRSQNRLNVDKS